MTIRSHSVPVLMAVALVLIFMMVFFGELYVGEAVQSTRASLQQAQVTCPAPPEPAALRFLRRYIPFF